nr:MAG TPA: hypothetical protein [Bacteriophage sp.]
MKVPSDLTILLVGTHFSSTSIARFVNVLM